uniref:Uncharacterized protein n=1 Tax=Tanacetum cinerariifolium TaxID=118510 RepID=A0A699KIX5_TANCI|nr:hypothetical protein [Tanacetum cinerariifolium]
MASESQPSTFLIKYHWGGVFVRDPLSYEYEILSEIPDSIFYLVPGLEFHFGLKPLKCYTNFDAFVQCGVNHDHVLHVYSSSSEFDLNEQNNDSESELDDDDYNVYDYASSAESDTASIDHLSEGEKEFLEVRTKKVGPKPKEKATMMFGEKFLTMIFNGLPKDDFDDCNDPKTDDQDMIGDHWPIHDPNIK